MPSRSPADAETIAMKARPTRRDDIPAHTIAGSSKTAIGLEYIAKVAALLAVALLVLVVISINRGREVQTSAKGIVADFHTANNFFTDRADFQAPTTAREELQQLSGVLTQLNGATETDVNMLAATVPDVQRLLNAGRGDVDIANQLNGVAATLKNAGQSLNGISNQADDTVSAVNGQVGAANGNVGQLNAVLAQIDHKLAVLPALPIPPSAGNALRAVPAQLPGLPGVTK